MLYPDGKGASSKSKLKTFNNSRDISEKVSVKGSNWNLYSEFFEDVLNRVTSFMKSAFEAGRSAT